MRIRKLAVPVIILLVASALDSHGDEASKRKERARSHMAEARRLAAAYKIDKAADKAREALKDDPNSAEAHVYLGLERSRAGDLKAAESEYSRALELDPYQAAAHCQLAYVYYQQGQLEPATDHWTLSVRLDGTSPQALAGLALAQFKQGQEQEALKTFDKALLYDRRFADPKFLASDSGPKWSGPLLQDMQQLLAKVNK